MAEDGPTASPAAEALTPSQLPEAYMIPRALAQATIDYLAMRPYAEVFALIRGFEALEPLPPASSPEA